MPGKIKDTIKNTLDVPDEVIDRAYNIATHKLDIIIERYGTENGVRLSEEYLLGLVLEQIRILNYQDFTLALLQNKEKEQVA